jgi:hypothetical protein
MDKAKITGLGGLLAGFIGSVCCVGPVILGGLGFGVGAISFARDLGFLHIPMMVLAFLLLGTAFYMRYQKADSHKGNSATCEVVPGKRRGNSIFLWAATVLTLILFTYPYLR